MQGSGVCVRVCVCVWLSLLLLGRYYLFLDITGVKFFQAVQNGDEEEHGCGGLAQVVVVWSKVVLGKGYMEQGFF